MFRTVAWAQMLWTYSSQSGSIIAGAQKTFDGKAPCAMCRKIAAAQQQQEKTPVALGVEKKSDAAVIAPSALVPPPHSLPFQYAIVEDRFFTRAEAPPSPVPLS